MIIIHKLHSIFNSCKLYSHYSDNESDQEWVWERLGALNCLAVALVSGYTHLFTYSLTHSVSVVHSFARSLGMGTYSHSFNMHATFPSIFAKRPQSELSRYLSPSLSHSVSLCLWFPLYLGYLSLPPCPPLSGAWKRLRHLFGYAPMRSNAAKSRDALQQQQSLRLRQQQRQWQQLRRRSSTIATIPRWVQTAIPYLNLGKFNLNSIRNLRKKHFR